MPTEIDTQAASKVATLVTFEYGDPPTVHRYAAWTSNISYGGQTYTALPALSVQYGKRDGTVKDVPVSIEMANVAPMPGLRGTFPPVAVTIRELSPGSDTSARTMWRGRISRATFNYNGNANAVRLLVPGHKTSLDATISLVVGRFCPWSFGQRPCGFDLEAAAEQGTITVINGQQITVSGLDVSQANRWRMGEVAVDGFPLSIHSHEQGSNVIKLVKPAPSYWQGRIADFYPGCDKTLADCQKHGQEEWFGAAGRKIPAREVRLEE